MIARTWHGRVPRQHAGGFHDHLLHTGVAEYRAARGCHGAQLLRRDDGAWSHFLLISYWESVDAVTQYAGPNIDVAILYPGDTMFELEADDHATHYEVLAMLPCTEDAGRMESSDRGEGCEDARA